MSIAADVREYVANRPAVAEALSMGIVNLSALSRRIASETGIEGDLAIQAACRRHQVPPEAGDGRLEAILSRAQLDVRTRIAVITAKRSWNLGSRLEHAMRLVHDDGGVAHVIHGTEAVLIIMDETHLDDVRELLEPQEIHATRRDLVQLNVRTSRDVEDVPGVLFRVAGVLSSRGINCVEVLACHKDNLFLVDQADLNDAMQALQTLLASAD